jgi:lysophospholipid acyltransferase (LPLAT)-like uncharacterized protein
VAQKWKILGVQTNIEWYDVKTKFKLLLRKVTYSNAFQSLICWIIFAYMNLVFYSSRRIFVNSEILTAASRNKTPLLIVSWHNRLMMVPFFTQKTIKFYPDSRIMSLASRHGDGQFVGKIMEKFGFISILGSTRDGRKASRGIDVGSFKKIFNGLKQGHSLALTPDGPRGPNQKINGEAVNIARIAKVGIVPISYSSSRFKRLKTWDKFTFPLPFSTLCFYCDEAPIYLNRDASEEEVEKVKNQIEERMNLVQEKSQEVATKGYLAADF